MKLTRHNGRAGKHGIYNPKHNDRRFDLENSEHIDSEKSAKNIYWNCYTGFNFQRNGEETKEPDLRFDEVEQMYYAEHYGDFVTAQNLRNEKTRHTERNRTVEDLLKNKQTCPEETIYQIGNFDQSVSPETLFQIADTFFRILESRYGEYYHSLNWALHVDEGTPHIHERHVFDCENRYGEICPQQEKALEKMGIPLPNPDAKKSKNNNRKMMFDTMCRDLLMDICENHALYLDKEPVYGGRQYMEKQDYILAKQKEQIEVKSQKLDELTMKIDDVEALIEDVTDAAYDKVVETVTETVRAETVRQNLEVIDQYQRSVTSPATKNSKQVIQIADKILNRIKERLQESAGMLVQKMQEALKSPDVKREKKEQIKEKARESIKTRLKRGRIEADRYNQERYAAQNRPAVKKQNMER